LDEPEFYCLDIPGFGSSLKLNSPLMMHTCKHKSASSNGDDEMFAYDSPNPGQIEAFVYGKCAQVEGPGAGKRVYLEECSNSGLQQFIVTSGGQIQYKAADGSLFCMASADGQGQVAGGKSNLRRNMRMQPCDAVAKSLSTWVFPGTAKAN
jgi:hypothetical protein